MHSRAKHWLSYVPHAIAAAAAAIALTAPARAQDYDDFDSANDPENVPNSEMRAIERMMAQDAKPKSQVVFEDCQHKAAVNDHIDARLAELDRLVGLHQNELAKVDPTGKTSQPPAQHSVLVRPLVALVDAVGSGLDHLANSDLADPVSPSDYKVETIPGDEIRYIDVNLERFRVAHETIDKDSAFVSESLQGERNITHLGGVARRRFENAANVEKAHLALYAQEKAYLLGVRIPIAEDACKDAAQQWRQIEADRAAGLTKSGPATGQPVSVTRARASARAAQ